MTKNHIERGRGGEDAAALHLEAQGLRILARNVRVKRAELDIVALDGDTVVFVEVKLRRGDFDPLEAVDGRKQRRILRGALEYLARQRALDRPVRFDVVAVDGRTMACLHIPAAFDAESD